MAGHRGASPPAGLRELLDNDRLPARRGDLGRGRFAELIRMHDQRLGQLAVAEDLDAVIVPPLDEPPGTEGRLVDDDTRFVAGLERREVDDRVVLLEGPVEEATFGDPAGQGHLAAFEQRTELEALARRVP